VSQSRESMRNYA